MTRKPTENGEAYLAFVQAHDLSCAFENQTKLKQSEQLYQRAIDLGSKLCSRSRALFAIGKLDAAHTTSRLRNAANKARSLAEQALQLQPDLPEAHLALGCLVLLWR